MKKILSACLISLLLGTTFPAIAQTQSQSQTNKSEPVLSEAITVNATVEKVSPRRKLVTLKDPDGNLIMMKFGDAAPDLSKFHKGDQVVASYLKSAAIMLAKPGEEPTGRAQEEFVVQPAGGAGPGGVVVNTIRTSATIENVDPKKRQVTVKEPDGRTVKLKVDNRVTNLDQIKPGDKIVVRYTEAAGISLAKSQS
ncbi:MAG: hypothetical protein JWR19_1859 [Pedosphaera sp.]|jgi:hypothetical protein|nr:hypothetical protein [Pedosphaera sp.]